MLFSTLRPSGGASLPVIGDCALFYKKAATTSYLLTADVAAVPSTVPVGETLTVGTDVVQAKLPYTDVLGTIRVANCTGLTTLVLPSLTVDSTGVVLVTTNAALTSLTLGSATDVLNGGVLQVEDCNALTSLNLHTLHVAAAGSLVQIIDSTALASVTITALNMNGGSFQLLGSPLTSLSIGAIDIGINVHSEVILHGLSSALVNSVLAVAKLATGNVSTAKPLLRFGSSVYSSPGAADFATCQSNGWSIEVGGVIQWSFTPDTPAAAMSNVDDTTATGNADRAYGTDTLPWRLVYDDGTADPVITGSDCPAFLTGLLPAYPYAFYAAAANTHGASSETLVSFSTTGAAQGVRPPSGLATPTPAGDQTLRVGWTPTPYAVDYQIQVDGSWLITTTSGATSLEFDNNGTPVDIGSHSVQVYAVSPSSTSAPSASVSARSHYTLTAPGPVSFAQDGAVPEQFTFGFAAASVPSGVVIAGYTARLVPDGAGVEVSIDLGLAGTTGAISGASAYGSLLDGMSSGDTVNVTMYLTARSGNTDTITSPESAGFGPALFTEP